MDTEQTHQELLRIRWAFNKVKADINAIDKDIYRSRKFEKQIIEKLDYFETELNNLKKQIQTKNKSTNTNKTSNTKNATITTINHKIIANKRTGKVHYSTCNYAKKTSKENLIEFETVKDALKEGYNRCSCIFNN